MNTDKIYAESIVNEYSAKKTSKVVALKKLDAKVIYVCWYFLQIKYWLLAFFMYKNSYLRQHK